MCVCVRVCVCVCMCVCIYVCMYVLVNTIQEKKKSRIHETTPHAHTRTMCPDTTCVYRAYAYIYSSMRKPGIYFCVSSVLMLLYMCPHTTICVSSHYCICVLILLYMCPHTTAVYLAPHTTICVSSHYCICVLTLLYMCPHTSAVYLAPHTTIYVSSHYWICVLIVCVLILLLYT
jgi:hypothetical protein